MFALLYFAPLALRGPWISRADLPTALAGYSCLIKHLAT